MITIFNYTYHIIISLATMAVNSSVATDEFILYVGKNCYLCEMHQFQLWNLN